MALFVKERALWIMIGRVVQILARALANSAPLRASLVCLLLAAGFLLLVWHVGPDGRDAMATRQLADRSVRVIDHVTTWKWWVSAAGLVIMVVAAATSRWWAGRPGSHPLPIGSVRGPAPWTWWTAAGLLVLCGALLRAERLHQSLYNDEAYSFRRYIAGQWRDNPETGMQEFKPPKWSDTTWHMQVGNNSPPYSLLARICHETVSRWGGLSPGEVHEVAIRVPAFVFGLAGLLALGWVARRLGSPEHGLAILAIAALHPWLLRYGTEARGHSLLLPALPLLLAWGHAALAGGRWRHWMGFGLISLFMMWAFAGSLYFLLAANLGIALLFLLLYRAGGPERAAIRTQVPRWLLANSLAGLLFLLLFLPMWSQMRDTMGEIPSLRGAPDAAWWPKAAAKVGIGTHWADVNPDSPHTFSMSRALAQAEWRLPLAMGCFAILFASGALWWWRRRRVFALFLAGQVFLAPLLAFLVARATDTVLHPWYVLAAVPPALILLGGAFGWGGTMRSPRFAIAILAVLWAVGVAPVIGTQRAQPHQPMREVVEAVRGGAVFPHYLGLERSVEFARFWTDLGVYDPQAVTVWSIPELQVREQIAREAGRPLYLAFAHREIARNTVRELVEYVEESGRYEPVATFFAMDHGQFNHHLFRMVNPARSSAAPATDPPFAASAPAPRSIWPEHSCVAWKDGAK